MIAEMTANEIEITAKLAVMLFEKSSEEELIAEFQALLQDDKAKIFLCFDEDLLIGFAQCQLRSDYVEGTATSPVGYLEGVFVLEEYRNRGYARLLVDKCCGWAKEKGCSEFASDCEFDNRRSLLFHNAVGFTEANRIICFTKKL